MPQYVEMGSLTELRVAYELARYSVQVFAPMAGLGPVDLIACKDRQIARLQCKTGSKTGRGSVSFKTVATRDGEITRVYKEFVEAFAVYEPEDDQVFIIPISLLPAESVKLTIRTEPNAYGNISCGLQHEDVSVTAGLAILFDGASLPDLTFKKNVFEEVRAEIELALQADVPDLATIAKRFKRSERSLRDWAKKNFPELYYGAEERLDRRRRSKLSDDAIEQRKKSILESGIDFTERGAIATLAKREDLHPNSLKKFIERYMPDTAHLLGII